MAFWLLPLIVFVESVLAVGWLFLIPPDPKNAAWLGYSLQRWLLIGGLVIAGLLCQWCRLFNRLRVLPVW